LIAHCIVESEKIAPHVTSFIRVDVTNLVAWRKQVKEAFKIQCYLNLTYFPIFMAVTARALQAFPLFDAIVEDNHWFCGSSTIW
jgi:2-oxoglutarate dehydrogenase E2 component (dihydrolipoamide succinyltransferase)